VHGREKIPANGGGLHPRASGDPSRIHQVLQVKGSLEECMEEAVQDMIGLQAGRGHQRLASISIHHTRYPFYLFIIYFRLIDFFQFYDF
jgi:hypothetical protein